MPEKSLYDLNKFKYQPVYRLVSFFENIANQNKFELQHQPSLVRFINLLLNQIYSNLFKFFEDITGTQLYTRVEESTLPNISAKTKKIIANLVQKNIIKKITKIIRIFPDEPEIVHYQVKTPDSFPDISLYSDGSGA